MQVGIRREDKSKWEARVPLTPADVHRLAAKSGVSFRVAPSDQRVFADQEFLGDGVSITDDLSPCPVILGVKEIPPGAFEPQKTYVFFSHTIKGQPYNMPMLKRIMALGCTLIDYELITDDTGRRLVFFGRHAGLAGMIDALWAYGRRCQSEGVDTPFAEMQPAHRYADLDAAREAVIETGRRLRASSDNHPPLVCGFAGYGRVSQGAQEIFDLLEPMHVEPARLAAYAASTGPNAIAKVVFKECDMVARRDGGAFALQEYYDHPELYRSRFDAYWPELTMLVNCIYWEPKYPRLVTIESLKKHWTAGRTGMKVIADITCDVAGSIECNVRATDPGDPVYVYDVGNDRDIPGFKGDGPVVLAVDILPTELPRESSQAFSEALVDFIPQLAAACAQGRCDVAKLPPPLRRAVIVDNGKLVERFAHLSDEIDRYAS